MTGLALLLLQQGFFVPVVDLTDSYSAQSLGEGIVAKLLVRHSRRFTFMKYN
jgi:hypothetical protein